MIGIESLLVHPMLIVAVVFFYRKLEADTQATENWIVPLKVDEDTVAEIDDFEGEQQVTVIL
jgi:hypothetical protein